MKKSATKKLLLFGAVIGSAMMGACSRQSAAEDSSIAFETFQTGHCYVLQGSASDFQQSADIMFYDSVSLVMPTRLSQVDISQLRDSITSYAFGQRGVQSTSAAINRWLTATANDQGYKATTVSASPGDAMGYCYLSGYVVYLSADMLVYCVQTEVYNPGAAHGMSNKRYINYRLDGTDKGQIMTLSDIFTSQGLAKLPDMIAEQTANMSDLIGPTEVAGLPADNNFFISSEGQIVFAYQPYEIADFARGFINVPFEPYELVELMTPLGVRLFNLSDFNVIDDPEEPTPSTR